MNQNKTKNQSGRSMVEMLGVLAIIGVLSVGGIAGYRYAMDRIIMNDVLDTFNIAATLLREARETMEPDEEGLIRLPVQKVGKYYATMVVSTVDETQNSLKLGVGDFTVGLRTTLEGDNHIPVRKEFCKPMVEMARAHPLTGRINTITGSSADMAISFVLAGNKAQFYIDKTTPISDTCSATGYARQNCCPSEDAYLSGMYGNLDQ